MLVEQSKTYRDMRMIIMPDSDHITITTKYGEFKGMVYTTFDDAKRLIDDLYNNMFKVED